MKALFSKKFKKMYLKAPSRIQSEFDERLKVFYGNPNDEILNRHPLQGEWRGHYSINVTGDIRALYKVVDIDVAYFVVIGSHSELYS